MEINDMRIPFTKYAVQLAHLTIFVHLIVAQLSRIFFASCFAIVRAIKYHLARKTERKLERHVLVAFIAY